MSPTDDVGLIVRAQAGDLRAFEELLRAVGPPLRRYVSRLLGARPLTEDVLQETFVRMWRGIGWLRDPGLFRSWTYRIATREAHRLLGREHRLEEAGAGVIELEQLQAAFVDPAIRLDLESTLMRITPLARTVIVAHYFEGLTLEDVAAVVEAPLGTIKSRLASGLKQARALMDTTE